MLVFAWIYYLKANHWKRDATQVKPYGRLARELKVSEMSRYTSNPIFGIDLTDEERKEYPESIRFTKTSRRLLQDSYNLNKSSTVGVTSINSAVVFGHSLNMMDYDYFFYLFTMLQFHSFEIDKMGSIVFVYDEYDSSKSDEIRSRYTDAIYSLLNYYEDYMSQSRRNILINLLRFSGKLKIKQLK